MMPWAPEVLVASAPDMPVMMAVVTAETRAEMLVKSGDLFE